MSEDRQKTYLGAIVIGVATSLLVASIVGLIAMYGTVSVHAATLATHESRLNNATVERREMLKCISEFQSQFAASNAKLDALLDNQKEMKAAMEADRKTSKETP